MLVEQREAETERRNVTGREEERVLEQRRMRVCTFGVLCVTGLSTCATGSRMLNGTNPTSLNLLRHFHQRLEDSIT